MQNTAQYDVFISYRRANGNQMVGRDDARLLQQALQARGLKCFFDYDSMRDGRFDESLLRTIEATPNFILVMPTGTFDRCVNSDDWVRREICHALTCGKRIIPVVPTGSPCAFPDRLPECLADLRNYHISDLDKGQLFEESVDKLVRERIRSGVSLENCSGEVRHLHSVAVDGDAEMQYNLGLKFSCGNGVVRDDAEAVRWYQLAAAQGHAKAQNRLGLMCAGGIGVTKDEAKAVVWYRRAAEQGNADAQCNLGVVYANGLGVVRDDAEALLWYRKSAEQGNARAQCNLGGMYFRGQGVVRNETEAATWYRRSAELGCVIAQIHLCMMYAFGCGVTEDRAESAKWESVIRKQGDGGMMLQYREIAEQGDVDVQFALASMYIEGWGVERNGREAERWCRKSAEWGDAIAQVYLATLYAAQNKKESEKWLVKAAEQGGASIQNMLGMAYSSDEGTISRNDAEAVRWFREAAEQGHEGAQANLGAMYWEGKGVSRDRNEGLKWTRMAAEKGKGNAILYYTLGSMYIATGNRAEGVKWLRKSDEQGYFMAGMALRELTS